MQFTGAIKRPAEHNTPNEPAAKRVRHSQTTPGTPSGSTDLDELFHELIGSEGGQNNLPTTQAEAPSNLVKLKAIIRYCHGYAELKEADEKICTILSRCFTFAWKEASPQEAKEARKSCKNVLNELALYCLRFMDRSCEILTDLQFQQFAKSSKFFDRLTVHNLRESRKKTICLKDQAKHEFLDCTFKLLQENGYRIFKKVTIDQLRNWAKKRSSDPDYIPEAFRLALHAARFSHDQALNLFDETIGLKLRDHASYTGQHSHANIQMLANLHYFIDSYTLNLPGISAAINQLFAEMILKYQANQKWAKNQEIPLNKILSFIEKTSRTSSVLKALDETIEDAMDYLQVKPLFDQFACEGAYSLKSAQRDVIENIAEINPYQAKKNFTHKHLIDLLPQELQKKTLAEFVRNASAIRHLLTNPRTQPAENKFAFIHSFFELLPLMEKHQIDGLNAPIVRDYPERTIGDQLKIDMSLLLETSDGLNLISTHFPEALTQLPVWLDTLEICYFDPASPIGGFGTLKDYSTVIIGCRASPEIFEELTFHINLRELVVIKHADTLLNDLKKLYFLRGLERLNICSLENSSLFDSINNILPQLRILRLGPAMHYMERRY